MLEEQPNSLLLPEAAITYDSQKHAFVDLADPGAKNFADTTPATKQVPRKPSAGCAPRTSSGNFRPCCR